MKRNVDLNEITDGNIYTSDSLVKISCNDCEGCDKCCHNMGESIVLDPYDIWQISIATGKSFEQMLNNEIKLSVVDGVILPHINMKSSIDAVSNKKQISEDGQCTFLVNGRCSIHSYRPGICRLFPLGRLYKEDGTFDYINQIYECDHANKSKVKIKKWLGITNIGQYEAYITQWHNFLKKVQEYVHDDDKLKKYNMLILQVMFASKYSSEDFYQEFISRIQLIESNV